MHSELPPPTLRSLRPEAEGVVRETLNRTGQLSLVGPPLVGKRDLAVRVANAEDAAGRRVWALRRSADQSMAEAIARFCNENGLDEHSDVDLLVVLDGGVGDDAERSETGAWLERLRQQGMTKVLLVRTAPLGITGEHCHELAPLDVDGLDATGTRFFFEEIAARRGTPIADSEKPALLRLAIRIGGYPEVLSAGADLLRSRAPEPLFGVMMSLAKRVFADGRADPNPPLPAELAVALADLSIIEGGFTLDVARHILGEHAPSQLTALHQRGLLCVRHRPDGEIEYRGPGLLALHVAQRIAWDRVEVIALRHARYYAETGIDLLELANDGDPVAKQRLEACRGNVASAIWGIEQTAPESRSAEQLTLLIRLYAVATNADQHGTIPRERPATLEAELRRAAERGDVDAETLARGYLALAHCQARLGEMEASEAAVAEALVHATAAQNVRLTSVCELNIAIGAWGRDECAEATRAITKAEEGFRATGNARAEGRALEIRGLLAQDAGDWDGAARAFARARALFHRTGARANDGLVTLQTAVLQMTTGRWQVARSTLEEALSLNEECGVPLLVSMCHVGRARVAAWFGDAEGFDSERRRALTYFDTLDNVSAYSTVRSLCAEAGLWLGRPREAELEVRRALPDHEQTQDWRRICEARFVVGVSLWMQGRPLDAEQWFARSASETRESQSALRIAISEARLGALLATIGRRSEANAAFARADATAAETENVSVAPTIAAWRAVAAESDTELAPDAARLWLAHGCGEPPVERYPDVRLASALLPLTHYDTLSTLLRSHHDGNTTVVGPEGKWVISARNQWIDLGSRPQLAQLVTCLANLRRREPGAWISRDDLFELLWPDDALGDSLLSNRLHKTLSVLRREGLGPHLESDSGAYRLRPDEPLSTIPPSARALGA